ncbi:MAG: hypothetical protein FWD57_08370 [Polyangiaceae bacterium]|nr:hypothetical protein [Polyangiaceae bacterium]
MWRRSPTHLAGRAYSAHRNLANRPVVSSHRRHVCCTLGQYWPETSAISLGQVDGSLSAMSVLSVFGSWELAGWPAEACWVRIVSASSAKLRLAWRAFARCWIVVWVANRCAPIESRADELDSMDVAGDVGPERVVSLAYSPTHPNSVEVVSKMMGKLGFIVPGRQPLRNQV